MVLPASRWSQPTVLRNTPFHLPSPILQGFHLLRRAIPGHFGQESEDERGSCNPTSLCSRLHRFGLPSAAFGRPYSRHPCWFLFLRVLRCFNSPRSRGGVTLLNSAIPGSTAACAYPGLIAACHGLRRLPSQAIPQAACGILHRFLPTCTAA